MITSGRFLSRLAGRYRHILMCFLPEAIARDREARNRALMFLISHTMGPALGNTVPLALWTFDPTPRGDVAVLTASISIFWLFPVLLRRGVLYERLVLCSVVNLNFCILWSCYHYGGVASPTLPWVLIIPILSLFYVGGEQHLQFRLLAVTGASFVIFTLASTIVPPAPNDIPRIAMHALGAISTVATLCYVATMAIYYARIFDAGVDLEREIQRRQVMAKELRDAVVKADRSGAAKAEFLAHMSHEIRTPLNAIIGYGEVLQEEAVEANDEALKRDVERILDAGRYLLRLINMVLDLSKIEARRMTFDMQMHSLWALLSTAVTAHQQVLEVNAVRIAIDVAAELDQVEVDQVRVLQVINAILENAARHSVGGSITMTALAATVHGHEAVSVAIRDTGEGIAFHVLPTLFKTFSTSQEASSGRYGGTGLSLTVCSRLCEAMGGSLSARSTPGQGSTFTMTLPRRPSTVVHRAAVPLIEAA